MSRATFESAFGIPLYMRRARAGVITFSFFNSDDTDYNDFSDGRVLKFYVRRNPTTTPVFTLAAGSGLTIANNDITAAVNVLQSTLAPDMYWWELYDETNSKTLGIDRLQIGTQKPIEAEQTVSVTLASTTIRVTMMSGGVVDHSRGGWDASGNTFPTTGGSGGGGAIQIGDEFYISNIEGGTLPTAGQALATFWSQYSIARYLGNDQWRLY